MIHLAAPQVLRGLLLGKIMLKTKHFFISPFGWVLIILFPGKGHHYFIYTTDIWSARPSVLTDIDIWHSVMMIPPLLPKWSWSENLPYFILWNSPFGTYYLAHFTYADIKDKSSDKLILVKDFQCLPSKHFDGKICSLLNSWMLSGFLPR